MPVNTQHNHKTNHEEINKMLKIKEKIVQIDERMQNNKEQFNDFNNQEETHNCSDSRSSNNYLLW